MIIPLHTKVEIFNNGLLLFFNQDFSSLLFTVFLFLIFLHSETPGICSIFNFNHDVVGRYCGISVNYMLLHWKYRGHSLNDCKEVLQGKNSKVKNEIDLEEELINDWQNTQNITSLQLLSFIPFHNENDQYYHKAEVLVKRSSKGLNDIDLKDPTLLFFSNFRCHLFVVGFPAVAFNCPTAKNEIVDDLESLIIYSTFFVFEFLWKLCGKMLAYQ